MPNYQKMYYLLFNRITDIIEQLQMLQRDCEELYSKEEPFIEVAFEKDAKPPTSNISNETSDE